MSKPDPADVLAALQRCVACGGLAEVAIGARGYCAACAVPVPGEVVPLAHAAAALALEDGLLPFLPRGRR